MFNDATNNFFLICQLQYVLYNMKQLGYWSSGKGTAFYGPLCEKSLRIPASDLLKQFIRVCSL